MKPTSIDVVSPVPHRGWIKFAVAAVLAFGVIDLNYNYFDLNRYVHAALAVGIFVYSITVLMFMPEWIASGGEKREADYHTVPPSLRRIVVPVFWALAFRFTMLLVSSAYALQAAVANGQSILVNAQPDQFLGILAMLVGYLVPPSTELLKTHFPQLQIAELDLSSSQGFTARLAIYALYPSLALFALVVIRNVWSGNKKRVYMTFREEARLDAGNDL